MVTKRISDIAMLRFVVDILLEDTNDSNEYIKKIVIENIGLGAWEITVPNEWEQRLLDAIKDYNDG